MKRTASRSVVAVVSLLAAACAAPRRRSGAAGTPRPPPGPAAEGPARLPGSSRWRSPGTSTSSSGRPRCWTTRAGWAGWPARWRARTWRWSTSRARSPSGGAGPQGARGARGPVLVPHAADAPSTSSPTPGSTWSRVANNHGADYGPEGLRDTLRPHGTRPLALVGVGPRPGGGVRGPPGDGARDRPRLPRRRRDAAGGGEQRVGGRAADARDSRPRAGRGRASCSTPYGPLTREVDVVVVYVHWGASCERCPTAAQRSLAGALARAGADVVVGSHAHVQLGRRLAGRGVRGLRPGQLRLVPRPPARHRRAAAPDRGRRGRRRRAGSPAGSGPGDGRRRWRARSGGRRSPTGRGCAGAPGSAPGRSRLGPSAYDASVQPDRARRCGRGWPTATAPAARWRGGTCGTCG